MMKKFVLFLALLLSSPVHAQTIDALGAGAAVTDTDLYPSYQGANPAKRVTAAQVKTYANTSAVRATTTTGEAIANSDQNKLVTFSNAAAVACTIAQAGSGGNFAAGWAVSLKNLGAGTVTCTPTTSTVDGAANFTLTTGQGVDLYSDGANYFTQPGKGSSPTTDASLLTSGTLAAARLPAFTGDCTAAVGTGVTVCTDPHPGYITSNWYIAQGPVNYGTSNAAIANRIVCYYAYYPRVVTIRNVAVGIVTAGSSNLQVALYRNSAGNPAALIDSTPNMPDTGAAATVTGALGADQQVGPGTANGRDIWHCSNQNDSTVTYRSAISSASMSGNQFLGSAALTNLLGSGSTSITGRICSGAACNGGSSTFGTWPASLTGTTWSDQFAGAAVPLVAVQIVSSP
jgi:hypothetical protein